MADDEDDPSPESPPTEFHSPSTFSFPSPAEITAASIFNFHPAGSSFRHQDLEPDSGEFLSCSSAASLSGEITELPESQQDACICHEQEEGTGTPPEADLNLESSSECNKESTETEEARKGEASSGSSKPDMSTSSLCHGILGQLIVSDGTDHNCDVLDVMRKGWPMVARMSGWLACRGCCYKPANCCHHHSPGSEKGNESHARKDSQDTTGTSTPSVGHHTRKDSGETNASVSSNSTTASTSCCSRKSSSLSPLKSPRSSQHSRSFSGSSRKELQSVTSGTTCSTPRKSGVTPLRSSRLSSAEELSVHVPPGMIGLAWVGTEPLLLTSKSYTFPASSSFSLQELALESTRVIHHGYLHRVVIPEGKLGVAWVDGQAKVLEPGIHVLKCATFAYTTADDRDASHKEVALGPFRVITVKEDEVGVKYCNRKPHLLYAGRHLIDISRVEVFAGFESLRIRKTTASDLVACSRDEVMVEAQVSFRWQIAPQDIAIARGASVSDIESAVVAKLRRAFAIVFWCLKGDEVMEPYSVMKDDTLMISGPMKAFSTEISKKCLEAVVDLFDEGWTVTFWGMWFESMKLRRYSRVRPVKSLQSVQQESKSPAQRKKKVQIVLTEES